MKFFNTAGPVNKTDHYCLPPLERFDLAEIEILMAQKKYFVLHKSLEATLEKGLEKTRQYMNTCGTTERHLVIFNRDPDVSWEDKISQKTETRQGTWITVWGM